MNAAMLMAKTISLFRCLGKAEHDPARLLSLLNDEIVETASHGMFVTMAAGLFDPSSGELTFANAGHQPPLYRNRQGGYRELEESSPPLGIMPGLDCVRQCVQLDGGRLYVFTDGVTEGWAEAGEMLGLMASRACSHAPCRAGAGRSVDVCGGCPGAPRCTPAR